MPINQVNDVESWKTLLEYYMECLREENRRRYSIQSKDIKDRCYFLFDLNGSFLGQNERFLTLTRRTKKEVTSLQHFVLGDGGKPPSVSFGYPFYVGSSGQVMPLLYVQISGSATNDGVMLTRDSIEVEINFAALLEVFPQDKELDLDKLFAQFDVIEVAPGRSRFDQMLDLVLTQLEEIGGVPVPRLEADEFNPQNMPVSAVVNCPLLFQVTANFTNQLLRELDQLRTRHNWDDVQPALRQMLTETDHVPYTEVPELVADPRLYVVPANDSQRKAVTAAAERRVTVVSGPPGTGKSQLILNIVGDTVLNGQTILIASRNNQAVNVISDRFLNQIDYPGTVRTGTREYRRKLPGVMQQAYQKVRRGALTSRLKEIRAEYDQLLQKIETQRELLATVTQLSLDKNLYLSEQNDLVELLPEAVRASIAATQVCLEPGEGEKLNAAIRTLIEETREIIDRRQALVDELQVTLVENREDLILLKQIAAFERRFGISIDGALRPNPLVDFAALGTYLQQWENLLQALRLTQILPVLRDRVSTESQQADEARQGLLADLITELGLDLERFSLGKEQSLRLALLSILKDAQATVEGYNQFMNHLIALAELSPVISHLLELVTGQPASTLTKSEPDLLALDKMLSALDGILNAHHTYTAQVEIDQHIQLLRREQAVRLAEFEAMLADLNKTCLAARAVVPALLLAQIEPLASQGEVKAWEGLVGDLAQLDAWSTRIEQGQLTWRERLRLIFSKKWPLQYLKGQLGKLQVSHSGLVTLNPVEQPADQAPFTAWAEYIRTWARFSQACYGVARLRYLEQQRSVYQEQSEQDIRVRSEQLQAAKNRLDEVLATLPAGIGQSMRSGAWPSASIDSVAVQELETGRYQAKSLVSQCVDLVNRLNQLRQECALSPQAVRGSVQSLAAVVTGDQAAPADRPFTPLTLMHLVDSWLHFSQANEAEYRLRQAQESLDQAEKELADLLAQLPDQVYRNADLTTIAYTDESDQHLQATLSTLQTSLVRLVSDWQQLLKRITGIVQENGLQSRAMALALKQTKKDANYLGGLCGRTYTQAESLLEDLKTWDLIVRIWGIMTRLVDVARKLGSHPQLSQVQADLNQLVIRRPELAGQVLTERWRQNAAELDSDTARGIGYYLDAITALAKDNCSDFYLYKQQAETYFPAALKLFPVWLTTNLSTQDLPLRPGLFDCVVIDEASQCDVPSALSLLYRAKRVVIIGDDQQLSHITTLTEGVHGQLLERHTVTSTYDYTLKSLFDLAAQSAVPTPGQVRLDEHYRSHPEIIEFSNQNFYDSSLKLKTDLSKVPPVYRDRGCGLYWVNVEGAANRPGPGQVYNKQEERAVVEICHSLVNQLDAQGLVKATVGIVTPYRSQARNIEQALKRFPTLANRVLVGTVHTYQGDERDVMIFSTVATADLPDQSFQFMADKPNLLNVAVTRARLTLIIVGHHTFFMEQAKSSPYYKLAAYARSSSKVFQAVHELPLFQPLDKVDQPFGLGPGLALGADTPYSNRLTLRQLLASSQEYLWWYDPHMRVEALDALALALRNLNGQIKDVRLLTSEGFWNNREKEQGSITKKEMSPLKQELQRRGVRLQLAVTSANGRQNPFPHDRFLFAANLAVNMPPVGNIYQDAARLAEFVPSTVKAEAFESWWQQAKVVYE